jgi:hypothetical protein
MQEEVDIVSINDLGAPLLDKKLDRSGSTPTLTPSSSTSSISMSSQP